MECTGQPWAFAPLWAMYCSSKSLMVSNVKFQEVVWSNSDRIKKPGATSRADYILYENISALDTFPVWM